MINSQNNAEDCPSPACEIQSSTTQQHSLTCGQTAKSEICGKQKLEPQNKEQLVCSAKSCQIFGTHDTEPMTDYPCSERRVKTKDAYKNSLGSPVGMVASNVNFKTEGKPSDITMARYATYLKAFVRLHLNAETMWTSDLLDDLMREGLALYAASEKNENKLDSPSDIYTASEKRILREFEMSGCQFHVELMKKFKLEASTFAETGGKGDGTSENVALRDLKSALRSFFRQYKYCLVSMGTFYALIWCSRGFYFVLDVCGRKLGNFYSDRENGVAMLICLKTLENVRHLLTGLTNLPKIDSCSLREVKLVKVVTPSGDRVQRDYGTRSHQYEIINDDYAYLKASLHLTLNKADLLRNRSALPVGVAAMVASKIDHPATWNIKMLDKIICFGVNFCQACWAKCMSNDPIDVEEFPSLFSMGQFKVNIELMPRKYQGMWYCVPGYKHSELVLILDKAFEAGDHKLLLQINYQMYTIWKKHGFIYLLDPYRHRILGKPGEPEVYEEMEKTASIRMFRSFDVFMNTLNHILLDTNRSNNFYIHSLKVKNVQFRDRESVTPAEEAKLGADDEIRSINEHICFEESEELCQKALGEVSDYEDEDLRSDVDELELKTSSSEAEEGLEEEEETAGGLEEELEGLESSSSGEDDKKKGKGGKPEKTGKGGKSKKGGKGGKGDKGKPGKGGRKGSQATYAAEVPDRKKAGEISNEDESKKKSKDAINDKNKDIDKSKTEDENAKKKAEEQELRKKKQAAEEDKAKTKNDSASKGDKRELVDKSGRAGNDMKLKETEKKMEETKQKTNLEFDKVTSAGDKDKDREKDQHRDKNKIKEKDNNKDKNKNKGKDESKDIVKEIEDLKVNEKLQSSAENAKEKEKVTNIEKYMQEDKDKPKEFEKSEDEKAAEKDKSKLPEKDKSLTAESGRQRHKISHKDGAEADDENEDDFFKNAKRFCSGPNPNRYPGYFKCPLDMAVVGSESGSYDSLSKLLQAGFRRADRILVMTPWNNFVLFRCMGNKQEAIHYYLFDGCTCNVNRFRHLDLSIGTAGLLCFRHMHDTIEYMRRIRKIRSKENRRQTLTADEICWQYCG